MDRADPSDKRGGSAVLDYWRYLRRYLPCYLFGQTYHMGDVNPRQPLPFMTLEEVAARTGRSVRVLQRWAVKGRIPAVKLGRIWIVNESDIPAIEAMQRGPGWPKGRPRGDGPKGERDG